MERERGGREGKIKRRGIEVWRGKEEEEERNRSVEGKEGE